MSVVLRKSLFSQNEIGQAMTEFVVVLPIFLIFTFATLGLGRLVYVRWCLEERARFAAFSAAHGTDGDWLFKDHLSHRPGQPSYMSGVTFNSTTDSFGGLRELIDSDTFENPSSDDSIPSAKLSVRQRRNSDDRERFRNYFWNEIFAGASQASKVIEDGNQAATRLSTSEEASLRSIDAYMGTQNALDIFDSYLSNLAGNQTPGAAEAALRDSDFQRDLFNQDVNTSIARITDNFTLSKIFAPKKSYIGAFEGLMKNVLSKDSSNIDSEIDNSVLHSSVRMDGMSSVLQSLPLRGVSSTSLTSNLYIITDPWDVDRQDGGSWKDLGSETSSYKDNDEEGLLKRRTLGLWLIPSNPGALLEPMTDLFPRELQSVANDLNGPISSFVGWVKGLLADNPLNKILDAVHRLPVIGSIFDFHLPEWPAVRPQAYPGSREMSGDMLSGSGRDFPAYVNEQRQFQDRQR